MKLIHIDTGIDQHPISHRFRVNVEYKGRAFVKWHDPDTSLDTMRRWRESCRVKTHYRISGDILPSATRTLATMVPDYLAKKKAHLTPAVYQDRERYMARWIDAFGDRDPRTLTYLELDAQLNVWKKTGRQRNHGTLSGDLSADTLNHHIKALSDFYRQMYATDDFNPCRHVKRFRVIRKLWRMPSMVDARRAVAAVGDGRRNDAQASASRVRLQVILESGIPHAMLKRVKHGDIHWSRRRYGTISLEARLKGGGTRPLELPLTPRSAAALREFDRMNLYGHFANSGPRKALRRACQRIGMRLFHPYLLRHRFITTLLERSGDLFATSQAALHTTLEQTSHYAQHAKNSRMEAALQKAFGRDARRPRLRIVKPSAA